MTEFSYKQEVEKKAAALAESLTSYALSHERTPAENLLREHLLLFALDTMESLHKFAAPYGSRSHIVMEISNRIAELKELLRK